MDIITKGLNYDAILQNKFNCWEKRVILQNIKRTGYTPLMKFFKYYCKTFNPMWEEMLMPLYWLIWNIFNDEDNKLFQNLYKLVVACAPTSGVLYGSMPIITLEQKLFIIKIVFNQEYSFSQKSELNYYLSLGFELSSYQKQLKNELNWWVKNELNWWVKNE
jgi:hypothetical protein